jgi:hypothetical protein
MSSLTDSAENALVDWFYRGQTAPSLPTDWFVALYTAAPGEAGGGTEATYTGYARVAITRSLAAWAGTQGAGTTVASNGSSGQTSNNGVVTFGAPTAGGPQTMQALALMSASTGGTMWQYGALTTPRVLNNGDQAPSIAAGQLTSTWA